MPLPPLKREPRDFHAWGTIWAGFGLLGGLFVIGALLWVYQKSIAPSPAELDSTPPPAVSAAGEAEFESGKPRQEMERKAREKLHSYGWVDKSEGIVRIPVRRAMEILSSPAQAGGL